MPRAKLISIESKELTHFLSQKSYPTKYCQELEDGNILFFPTCPFEFPKIELDFLLSQNRLLQLIEKTLLISLNRKKSLILNAPLTSKRNSF